MVKHRKAKPFRRRLLPSPSSCLSEKPGNAERLSTGLKIGYKMQSFFTTTFWPSPNVMLTSAHVQVLYERILPSPDPVLSARYTKLQQSAEAVFQGIGSSLIIH